MRPQLDIESGSPELAERVRDLAAQIRHHDAVDPFSEATLLNLPLDDPRITHATATVDGAIVGYAQVDRRGRIPSAELATAPAARRRGIGTMLLRTALRDASLPSQSGEPGQHAPLRVWAHGNLPAAQGLARAEGLSVVRSLHEMSRPLREGDSSLKADPAHSTTELPWIPSVAMVIATFGPDCLVETFAADRDEEPWLELNRRAFANHPEQGRLTLDDLRARENEPWFDAEGFFVVRGTTPAGDIDESGPLLASVWTKIEDERPGAGEIYVLAVDPDAQRRGWGKRLTMLALAYLRERELARATLWTDADNAAAVTTYERAGFTVTTTDVQYARASLPE